MFNKLIADLEQGFKAANETKSKLIERKLVQLVPNLEGFEAPTSFGVYRETGGAPLGVVGKDYQPISLNNFYDTIEENCLECGLDVSQIEYNEYKGGAKVSFSIPLKTKVLKSGASDDILDARLLFITGFDGMTKTSLNFETFRQICSNGMKGWAKDMSLSFKNTKGNMGKDTLLVKEIYKGLQAYESHVDFLNHVSQINISKSELKAFAMSVTGYKSDDVMTTRKANILDRIVEDIEIEMQTTGQTAFSLLQGITRYTTHNLTGSGVESTLFGTANKLNHKAVDLVSVM